MEAELAEGDAEEAVVTRPLPVLNIPLQNKNSFSAEFQGFRGLKSTRE